MVKNVKGGSGHKSQARKFTTDNTSKQSARTRLSTDVSEIYAQVTAVLGNGMCHVICADNTKRLCIIRGKFSGRLKRDNILSNGKWVLIGLREFETTKTGIGKDLDKCDLLEVYSDLDKDRLRAQVNTINWNIFMTNDCANAFTPAKDYSVDFVDDRTDEYMKLTKLEISGEAPKNISLKTLKKPSLKEEEDENEDEEKIVNIDDI